MSKVERAMEVLVAAMMILGAVLPMAVANDGLPLEHVITTSNGRPQGPLARTPHTPIRINYDLDFTSANGVVRGNGTQFDPYVIENWDINGTGKGYALYIGNTTSYFIVHNNTLHHANLSWPDPLYSSGLFLYNVKNGTVLNNDIKDNQCYGTYLALSEHISIFNNRMFSNRVSMCWPVESGLYLESSNYNQIYDNNISEGKREIQLYQSSYNNITNNQLWNSDFGTIYMSNSSWNLIKDNNGHALLGEVLQLESYSGNNTIAENIMSGVNYTISTWTFSSQNQFYNNDVIARKPTVTTEAIDMVIGNIWNDTKKGNRWHNYDESSEGCFDNDTNGICDTPYVLFGSAGAKDYYPITVSMPKSGWTNMSPNVHPSARDSYAMAYDSQSDHVILFGGSCISYTNETWAYDLDTNSWENKNAAGPGPSGRCSHAMAYNSKSDRIILFGGHYGGIQTDDTWAYDYKNNIWAYMNPSSKPSPRFGHAMVYDSRSDRIILFGGSTPSGIVGDTWAYDYNNNTWIDMKPTPSGPSFLEYHSMVYDSHSDRTILFGGYPINDETWAYDYNNNTWNNMNPIAKPSSREGSAMAYDSWNDRTILFGGHISTSMHNDTWIYDYNTNEWTNMTSSIAPPARYSHALVYDSHGKRAVLFGGRNLLDMFNDTWTYRPESTPPQAPIVTSTDPVNGAMDVPTNTNVSIVFSQSMDKSSTESAISAFPSIAGTFSWDVSAKTVTLTPASDLQPNTRYNVSIDTTAKSQAGVNMKAPYLFSFMTGNGTGPTPPVILATSPADGSMNVPLNANIFIMFSEAMDNPSVVNAINIAPPFAYTISWSGNVATLTPSVLFNLCSYYAITVDTTAKSQKGVNMQNPYTFGFKTECGPNSPHVLWTTPNNNETSVPIDVAISIAFNKTMNRSYTENAINASPSIIWTANWSPDDTIITFTLSSNLQTYTTYTIIIDITAMSADGANLANPYVFSFTTGGNLGDLPPNVLSTTPANGAKDVSLTTKVVIVFDSAMNKSATQDAINITPSIAWHSSWDIYDKVLTLTPSGPLQANTVYTVYINNNAMGANGTHLANGYKFSFTTMMPVIPPEQSNVPTIAVAVGTIAAAVAIAALLSIEWVYYALALLLVPLYMRLRKEQVMDNFLRGKIYQFIKDHPGAHLRMIKREMDVSMSVTCYHLKVLEEIKMVLFKNEGYRKMYYAIPKIKPTIGQALNELQRKIIRALSNRPGLRAITLSKYLKIEHITAMDNLRVLGEMGFVTLRKTSRGARYYASDDETAQDGSSA